jgi:hypothetical protein
MDSITSRSTPKSHRATQATRMLPVEAGQSIHLIVTCLLNARTSQISIAEIYEWLAQKYLEYQYTKRKIRKVLKHDSERKCPRFVIANKSRIVGVPLRWNIRPGTEPQFRSCFSGPPPTKCHGRESQWIDTVIVPVIQNSKLRKEGKEREFGNNYGSYYIR